MSTAQQRTQTHQKDSRQRDLATIHIARKELERTVGLTEDAYRDLLWAMCQVRSSADLDWTGRQRLLEHFKKLGFKPRSQGTPSKAAKPYSRPSTALAQDPESTMIRGLWLMLHELGAVRNPSEASLTAYSKRMTGVDALQWANGYKANGNHHKYILIESLKKWSMRHLPEAVKAKGDEVSKAYKAGTIQLDDQQILRLRSIVGEARSRGTFDPTYAAWLALKEALRTPAIGETP
jgi:hypothetical protein